LVCPAVKALLEGGRSHHRRGPLDRRYRQEIEAAGYFCCLEALQNVVKHAGASHAIVRLEETNGALEVSVADDAAGFDPEATPRGAGTANMADRLEALGRTVEVRFRPGEGTGIAGRIPARRTLLHVGRR
jgi:signal transduction histidine kinase